MEQPTPTELAVQAEIQQLRRRIAELESQGHATEREAGQTQSADTLHRQREGLNVILNSIGDAVLATDVGGSITFINPVAAALTGWSAEEALGRPAQDVFRLINEDTREEPEDIIGRVLREGTPLALANQTALLARDEPRDPG